MPHVNRQNVPQFIPYPPTDEHLDGLQVLAITVATCAAVHILLLVSLHTGTSIFTGKIHGGALLD